MYIRVLFSLMFLFSSQVFCLNISYIGQTTHGQNSIYFPSLGQSLSQVGRSFHLGPEEMRSANKHISDPWFLYPWQTITVPARHQLPDEIHQNKRVIVVILKDLRLYARFDDRVLSYSAGIGKNSTPTPTGSFVITKKIIKPTWYPPKSVIAEQRMLGNILPPKVPPGPENPLGTRGILFNKEGFLIHGTNFPGGVGRQSSAGCIRLLNHDVEELYQFISEGDLLIIK